MKQKFEIDIESSPKINESAIRILMKALLELTSIDDWTLAVKEIK